MTKYLGILLLIFVALQISSAYKVLDAAPENIVTEPNAYLRPSGHGLREQEPSMEDCDMDNKDEEPEDCCDEDNDMCDEDCECGCAKDGECHCEGHCHGDHSHGDDCCDEKHEDCCDEKDDCCDEGNQDDCCDEKDDCGCSEDHECDCDENCDCGDGGEACDDEKSKD